MSIIQLNQSLVSSLKCPVGKSRVEYCDADIPGLLLEVRASGASTYHLRYKAEGRTKYIKIAASDLISLAEARKKARALKAEIALGADPRGEQKKQKEVLTYSEFFVEFYLPHITPRKRSWYSDESLYRNRLKAAFGDKRLNQITRQQIQSFHTGLLNEGLAPATCNHHVKLLKHSLNMAIDWEMLDVNPAVRVPLAAENNNIERYMDSVELNRFLTVLRTDENQAICRIALFLLSTGCRLNEVLSAKWSDVDLFKRIFVIRASNSKSKKLRAVPLNDSALEVLSQLDTSGEFEYLFVNRQTGKPYVNVAKVFGRLRIKAGLPNLRIHDLRHQHASLLINNGNSLFIVQQILGHSDPKVTQRYAHLSSKTLQDASNSASAIIRGAMLASVTAVPELPSGALQGDIVDVVPVALPELLQADVLQEAEVRLAA